MSFIPPTVAQFKAQFPRDFKYGAGTDSVQDSDIQAALNVGQGNFNQRLFRTTIPVFTTVIRGDIAITSPNVANVSAMTGLQPGQTVVGAGIPSGTTILSIGVNSLVLSQNATATQLQAQLTVGGPSGFSVSEAQLAYLYLTAHFLVLNLQNAGGLGAPSPFLGQASSGGGVVAQKTVGGVSVAYTFPDFVVNSRILSQFLKTGYGQMYLQMVTPKIPARRVMVVGGEPTDQAIVNNTTVFIPQGPQ